MHIDTQNHRWAVQVPEEVVQDTNAVDEEPKKILVLDLELDPEELDWHRLPDGITLEYYEGSQRIDRGRYRILVNPTGTIDPHSIVFESNNVESLDERDRTRTVKVNFPGFVSFAVGKEIEEFKKSDAELR
jgi:hypothetical protein